MRISLHLKNFIVLAEKKIMARARVKISASFEAARVFIEKRARARLGCKTQAERKLKNK